jgi:hypothetical protein
MDAGDLGRWVNLAAKGESVAYGYASATAYPNGGAMRAAWNLCEAGLVTLTQRREPDGRLAYLATRTLMKPEDAATPRRRGSRGQVRHAAGHAGGRPSQATGDRCRVPGCGASLSLQNTAGVCRAHTHRINFCQCNPCIARGRRVAAE